MENNNGQFIFDLDAICSFIFTEYEDSNNSDIDSLIERANQFGIDIKIN